MVLSYCGLRWGELSGLRPIDVDLQRARLEIRRTVVMDKGYQRVEAPKDYEHRSIPISGFLLDPLRAQPADRDSEASLFFEARTRTWLRNGSFRDGWFDPASVQISQSGLTPHELRHTAASLAVRAGANVKAVQRMLGHASAAITLDVYADLFDDDLNSVAVALDRAASQTDVGKLWANGSRSPRVEQGRDEEAPG